MPKMVLNNTLKSQVTNIRVYNYDEKIIRYYKLHRFTIWKICYI